MSGGRFVGRGRCCALSKHNRRHDRGRRMRNFLCRFLYTLVICGALFSLVPRAAADAIVILPNGTLTGASISFQYTPPSGTPPGVAVLGEMIVNAPLAGNPNLALYPGNHLQQVIAELLYPGTNSPELTVTLQDCYVTSVSQGSGTETIDFAFEEIKYAYEPPPQVPEPGSFVLVAMGLAGLIGLRARKVRPA